jgi:predicted metal-binding protein
MVLQNCMDFLKVEPVFSDESCPASSHDGTQVIDIKVEVSDTQEVEDPLLITLPGIKAEHEVSCMSTYPSLGTFHRYLELCIVFPISICLSTSVLNRVSEVFSKKRLEVVHFDACCLCVPVPFCIIDFNIQEIMFQVRRLQCSGI